MKTKSLFWAKMLSVACFLLVEGYLVGCGKIDGLPVTNVGPTIPGLPAPVPNPPIGVVSNTDGFYVQHRTNANYNYVSHKGNATMATKCTAVAGELASCYVEAQELDLYFNGMDIQYNVPSTLCAYFVVTPYYYFYRQAGAGPATAVMDTDKNGLTGQDVNSDGIVDIAYTSPPCAFNYLADNINCCGGTYTLNKRVWDTTLNAGAGGYASSTQTNVSWGGNPVTCLTGPSMTTNPKDKYGRPVAVIQYVGGTGVNAVYTVGSPLAQGKSSVIYAANYWTPAEFPASSGSPKAFAAITAGGIAYAPSAVYDFMCLDTASEVISEVQLYVRSWTTKSAFLDLVANPGNFQISGAEPAPWNVGFDLYDYANWHSYRNPGGAPLGFPFFDN